MPEDNNKESQSQPTLQLPPEKPVRKGGTWVIFLAITLFIVGLIGAYLLLSNRQGENRTVEDKPSQNSTQKEEDSQSEEDTAIDCGSDRWFADEVVGMAFCYPNEWGELTVQDAKVGPDDTGHRQMITFAGNPNVSVGGVSDDWSTTVGRGTGCLEPNNSVPALTDYNTEWHDRIGEGSNLEYAQRSLPTATGGYDITESVSSLMQNGVCVQAHRVINGSRYKVAFVGAYKEFNDSITSPAQHVANPNVLLSENERQDLANVLASLKAYPSE